MTVEDFRRISLSLPGVAASSHMGAADFRVGGRVFATLAHQELGFGNFMLTPELQADFLADRPDLFLPIACGWGRMGMTHIRLDIADEDALTGALRTAWNHSIQHNEAVRIRKAKPRRKSTP